MQRIAINASAYKTAIYLLMVPFLSFIKQKQSKLTKRKQKINTRVLHPKNLLITFSVAGDLLLVMLREDLKRISFLALMH